MCVPPSAVAERTDDTIRRALRPGLLPVEMKLQPVKQDGTLAGALLREIIRAFGTNTFVETGTYLGGTARAAATLFDAVYTVELSEALYRRACRALADEAKVRCFHGDAPAFLAEVLPQVEGRALFWLDAHYSEGETAKGNGNTPILEEIAAIAAHRRDEVVVLVDDIRLFMRRSLQAEASSSLHGYPTLRQLYAAARRLGDHYRLALLGDVAMLYPAGDAFSVSPLVRACTQSRLFDDDPQDRSVEDVLAAEAVIAAAAGTERDALLDLYAQTAATEPYGLGGHYRLWRGLVLAGSGQPGDAVEEFERALRLGCDHWRIQWHAAAAAHRAGRKEVAAGFLERVLAEAPGFGPARQLHDLLCGKPAAGAPANGRAAAESRLLDVHTPAPEQLSARGLWQPGRPLRLHLGCGEQHFDGYVNLDYPPSDHNVMQVKADAYADITKLHFPDGSVDEIRLHHVFEHFSRVAALAQLVRWHRWLKVGGKLYIETPDLAGSAKTLLSNESWRVKTGIVRHLAGDQAAGWAYHLDHWFPERFAHTLGTLGFAPVETKSVAWPHEPYLSNVHAVATKARHLSQDELLAGVDALLWESTVADVEKPTYEVWRRQVRALLDGADAAPPRNVPRFAAPAAAPAAAPVAAAPAAAAPAVPGAAAFARTSSGLPLDEIHDFNQRERDRWVAAQARAIPAGSRVLDVGAGTCPYRSLFAHCDYKTHDFKQYEGVKLGGTSAYGEIDYVSDIVAIPVPDASFDVVLCTEVFEHIPEPIRALEEMTRIVRPGGRLLVTAPLGSGLHQLPYHFYGGYTPFWYEHFAGRFGLDVEEITPNGGFFRLLAQECNRFAWILKQHAELQDEHFPDVFALFSERLPRYLFGLEERCKIDQFTVGYHVSLRKPIAAEEAAGEGPAAAGHEAGARPAGLPAGLPAAVAGLLDRMAQGGRDVQDLVRLAVTAMQQGDPEKAERYLTVVRLLEPQHATAAALLEKIRK